MQPLHRAVFVLPALMLFLNVNPSAQTVSSPANPAPSPSRSRVLGQHLPEPADASVEHWDKLSLKDNDLHANPPVMGQTDTFPQFTRELLRVQWRGGDPIDLYIIRPVGKKNPPVILYLYGYPREAVRFLDPSFCETVTKNGFAAVGFSSMLTGQRYHDVSMKQWFVSDLQHSLVGTTHDVQMVINYLQARTDLDSSRIGIFGEGSGGTIALLAASVDARIKAVDVLNPWGDWPDWLRNSAVVPKGERADYLTDEFLRSVAPLDPLKVLPTLADKSLRLQETLWENPAMPSTARDRIAAALPPNAVLATYKSQEDYRERAGRDGKMLSWISDILMPSPSSAQAQTAPNNKAISASSSSH